MRFFRYSNLLQCKFANKLDNILDLEKLGYTVNGNPTISKFKNGDNCINLDGTGDYVVAPVLGAKFGSAVTQLSVSIWFKSGNAQSSDGIVTIGLLNNLYGKFALSLQSGVIYVRCNDVSTIINSIPFTDTTNWHHICVVYNGTTISTYLDNVLSSGPTAYSTALDFSKQNLNIGCVYNASNTFEGTLSQCILFNYALTSSEVSLIYNNTVFDYDTNVVALWDLSSINPRELTGVSIVSSNLMPSYDGGKTLSFDGVADYLTQKVYDIQQGVLSYQGNDTTTAEFRDTIQNFGAWQTISGIASYMLEVTNSDATISWGYLGTSNNGLGINDDIEIYTTKALAVKGWNGIAPVAGGKTPLSYEIRKTDFQITGAMSLGAWVKPNGTDEAGYIISKLKNVDYGFGLYWEGVANVIKFYYDGASQLISSSAVFTESNTWVFVAVTRDALGNVSFYKNAVLAGTGSGATISDSSYSVRIANRVNGTTAAQYFEGLIACPFIYNTQLLPIQIEDLYARTKLHTI